MEVEKGIRDLLKEKFILLDTNILISSSKHLKEFTDLFSFFSTNDCAVGTMDLLRFEYLRDAVTQENKTERELYLNRFSDFEINFASKYIKDCTQIGQIYSRYNKTSHQKISFIDCAISSILKNFHARLYLLTINHDDFPLILHDRIKVFTLDCGNEILNPALYSFNLNKLGNEIENVQKVKEIRKELRN
ncbi:MAG: hypothetical protein WCJ58_03365 [bacterium]